ncbi:DUF6514 family protein [Haloimpatiens sp. FM7330]|uniref:DUF6514 family protein n=1 Tax=Haloimpatiens sp. FM7330 TaxID=3298610 RepID=UPI0036438ECB
MLVVENMSRKLQEDKVTRNYFYRVVKDDIVLTLKGNSKKVQVYGIEIERQDMVDDNVVKIERDCVKVISTHRNKVHSLMKKLYNGVVSPIHLVDILGEDIDECVNDFEYVLTEIC